MYLDLFIGREEVLCDDEEPSRFMYEIKGGIYGHSKSDRRIKVGEFAAFQVNVERCVNEEDSAFDVFDTHSATMPYYELYDGDLGFPPKVLKALGSDGFWAPNMLILDRLVIAPKYRGRDYGLVALHALTVRLAMGCGIVAMKPYPLQYEGGTPAENQNEEFFKKAGLGVFAGSIDACTRKLRKHYGRLGFHAVPGTPFMVLNPNEGLCTLEELGLSGR